MQSEMLGITGMRWYFAVALEGNRMGVDTLSWRGVVIIRKKTKQAHGSPSSWYYRHELHRLDGPAEIWVPTGLRSIKTWYVNGMKHRLDGPARGYGNGAEEGGFA